MCDFDNACFSVEAQVRETQETVWTALSKAAAANGVFDNIRQDCAVGSLSHARCKTAHTHLVYHMLQQIGAPAAAALVPAIQPCSPESIPQPKNADPADNLFADRQEEQETNIPVPPNSGDDAQSALSFWPLPPIPSLPLPSLSLSALLGQHEETLKSSDTVANLKGSGDNGSGDGGGLFFSQPWQDAQYNSWHHSIGKLENEGNEDARITTNVGNSENAGSDHGAVYQGRSQNDHSTTDSYSPHTQTHAKYNDEEIYR